MEFALVAIVALGVVATTDEPEVLKEVKERYRRFRVHLVDDGNPRWKPLHSECLIVGLDKSRKELGWNTNKGYEIGLCVDGTANQIFHVLIHELAHCLTEEYAHNEAFWTNFKDLKDVAISVGLYEPITQEEEFCTKSIKDP